MGAGTNDNRVTWNERVGMELDAFLQTEIQMFVAPDGTEFQSSLASSSAEVSGATFIT
jgi:hypothetical protein